MKISSIQPHFITSRKNYFKNTNTTRNIRVGVNSNNPLYKTTGKTLLSFKSGKEKSFVYQTPDGRTIENDYANRRTIERSIGPDGSEQVKVIDMDTNLEVTTGEKTWVKETVLDKSGRVYYRTENIVKGIVVEEEWPDISHKEYLRLRYFEDESHRLKSKNYYTEFEEYVTKTYYNKEESPTASIKFLGKSGKYVYYIGYDEQGKEIEYSHTYKVESDDNRVYVRAYVPENHDVIDFEIRMKKDSNRYVIIEYNKNPNYHTVAKMYELQDDEDQQQIGKKELLIDEITRNACAHKPIGTLVQEAYLYRSKEVPKFKKEFFKDGSREETLYFFNGEPEEICKYDSQDRVTNILRYKKSKNGQKLILYEEVGIVPEKKQVVCYSYDEDGYITSHRTEENEKLVEEAYYYPESNDIHVVLTPVEDDSAECGLKARKFKKEVYSRPNENGQCELISEEVTTAVMDNFIPYGKPIQKITIGVEPKKYKSSFELIKEAYDKITTSEPTLEQWTAMLDLLGYNDYNLLDKIKRSLQCSKLGRFLNKNNDYRNLVQLIYENRDKEEADMLKELVDRYIGLPMDHR